MELKGHSSAVWKLTVLPDGRLVSGSVDNTIRIWDVDRGTSMELKGHSCCVSILAMFTDDWLVSAGTGEECIRIWDIKSGQLTAILGNNAYETLKTVVEIHEAAHALWHVGLDASGRAWADPDSASGVLHEIMAQHYTQALCQWFASSKQPPAKPVALIL